MKKNLILVIFLLAVLVILGVIFKGPKVKEETQVNGTQNITQVEGLIVADSYETKTLTISDPYVTFDVKYPYFKNADANFNSNIENLLKAKIEDHKKASKEYWQARYDTQTKGENFPKVPATDADKLYFSSDFTIVQSNSSYISFVLRYSGFSGGAHGYEINTSFNYDVKNQKLIELKDLFPNDSQYLTSLSNQSREFLMKEFATVSEDDKKNSTPEALKEYVDNIVSMINSGTEPSVENFSVFTFTGDKIKIYFAQYQVGPYAFGMPEVEIDRK